MSTVVVAGCGVIGPVIALLLKKKGYNPIIVEKVRRNQSVGLSLVLYPNGLKVLATIGLEFAEREIEECAEYTSAGDRLGGYDFSSLPEKYGFSSFGMRRAVLLERLKDHAVRHGVQVLEGWELQDTRELENLIVAIAKDGREIEASFLVGCDGVRSATRSLICQRHGIPQLPAEYTGLVATGGFSPTPTDTPPRAPRGYYGNAKYFVTYEVDEKYSVWAISSQAQEDREGWQQMADLEAEKSKLLNDFVGWPKAVRDLIAGTRNIAKYGLYDRPELSPKHWFHGRCVIAGDAAHPTSPHLGQGANQGLEDCWHLSQMLPDAKDELSTEELREVFQKYAEKRHPRAAALVKRARAQGEVRVTLGEEACKERNEKVKGFWANTAAIEARLHSLYQEPF